MSAVRILLALACVSVVAGSTAAQEAQPAAQAPAAAAQAQPGPPAYVGADKCKACHEAIYASWQETKHARAISRLSKDERQGDACIRCHVTGSPEQIAKEGAEPSLPGVQCESCHGPGGAHVADATVKTGLTKKPGESACTKCHNDKSPHFRGFVYNAMVGFSHPVKK